jgi:hypothetical protein
VRTTVRVEGPERDEIEHVRAIAQSAARVSQKTLAGRTTIGRGREVESRLIGRGLELGITLFTTSFQVLTGRHVRPVVVAAARPC